MTLLLAKIVRPNMLYIYNFDSGFHLVDLSCKAMYSKLLKQIVTEPTSVQYWETKLSVGERGIDLRLEKSFCNP